MVNCTSANKLSDCFYCEVADEALNNCSTETLFRSSHRGCSVRKGVLRNLTKLTGKYMCKSLSFNKEILIKKETLAQAFSCEF